MNPSANYECALLVDGFDSSPHIMMTYNPPYYADLIERAGLHKAKDLYAFYVKSATMGGPKIERVARRAAAASDMRIRPINMKAFWQDVETIWQVYNSAWTRNWGFVPMTRDEFFLSAREMKSILVPELVLLGEVQGRVVGFALALPDINQALKHAKGRLFPLGLLKILYHKRSIRSVRVIALGVLEEYRTAGVAAGFYAELFRQANHLGYDGGEMSWVLEDNALMCRSIEALGGKRYKTYRIYEWN
jgi:GNAT superfamily N-acetyltransferase